MSGTESSSAGRGSGREIRTVTAEKWNRMKSDLRSVKEKKDELVQAQLAWEKERQGLLDRVSKTEEEMKRKKIYRGRNKTKVANFDNDEHASNKVITRFIRRQVFPNIKFLHPSWTDYAPNVETSFFYKLRGHLTFPEELGEEFFWNNKIVPIVNKKICETRSNISQACRNGYLRRFLCWAKLIHNLYEADISLPYRALTHRRSQEYSGEGRSGDVVKSA